MERRVLLKTNLRRKSSGRHIEKFQRENLSLTSDTRTRTYRLKTKHWAGLRQFSKDKFMHMGLSRMEARILRVKLHQKLTSNISVALNEGAWRQRKDYFIIDSVIWEKEPQRRKNLKSAIQEVINSVNKLSCLPKQEDKEGSLCLKFKVGDNSLIIHISAYHLFSVLISKRGFSSLQMRRSELPLPNTRHKSDATQLRMPITSSFTLLPNISIVITNNRLVLLLPIGSNYVWDH